MLVSLMALLLWGSLCLCYGCVLSSPAAAGRPLLFDPPAACLYNYQTTLLLNEAAPGRGKDVGFQVAAGLSVETVWQSSSSPQNKLLKLKIVNPKLSIKSRKAPAPEGFITHASKLDELNNGAFLLHWNNGLVKSVYINQNEAISMINLKKGIASLFQFQLTTQDVEEADASGRCRVVYTSLDRNMIEKIKSNCHMEPELPYIWHPQKLWSAAISSKRRSVIVLSPDLDSVESIDSEERHQLSIPLREEAGGAILSQQGIKLQEKTSGGALIKESTIDAAVKNIEKSTGHSFEKHSLSLTKENNVCADGSCSSFHSLVKEHREALKTDNLGTIRSASAFVKLLNVVREAKQEDLLKTLKNSKNKKILFQLMDLLGAAQTIDSHEAALKVLNFKSEESLDLNERYLWSLSLGSHPVNDVVKDLIRLMEAGPYNEKLEETLVLTIAAMTNNLKNHNSSSNEKTVKDVLQILEIKMKACGSDDSCHLRYIRAFKNLKAEESIPTLLTCARTGSKRVSVAALNAIHSFPASYWTPDVLKAAKRVYFQLDKRYDSSARTLAIDILLESGPDDSLLSELLLSLTSRDPAYEVKQYLVQRLNQIGESDKSMISSVQALLKSLNLKNYNILSQRGLSTAFTRSFMDHPSANGTLSTIQEINGGIVKRGLVDVIIDRQSSSKQSIFTLGLFAGGLGSFLSSDETNTGEEEEEEETAIAGMDLTVMGVQVRPFVFFTGQGELMGHVWSGTASDRTSAFQALALLQDHLQYIPLESGFISELSLQGGISFDLSGKISLSIWNRNAESLVEKSAGLSVVGLMRVNNMFVHSQVQFNIATEAKLRLVSNIDFYSSIALCLQLQQPDSVIKHNVHKVERIPGSKHRLRKSKYKVIPVPGRTYALNQKNNELCNIIFAE